jgi:dTDP-4-dehydrorhamnose 3,5-epimerase
MSELAERGTAPSVVDDQFGRLTFTADLAAGIVHLLNSGSAFGTYNLSNSGPVRSWADIARAVFALKGHDPASVTGISTEDYFAGKAGIAPRPRHSALGLGKIAATGFTPRDADAALADYLAD